MTDLAYSLGDFFIWTFGIIEMLGNSPNVLFIILGFIGTAFWLWKQAKYSKADREAGRLI